MLPLPGFVRSSGFGSLMLAGLTAGCTALGYSDAGVADPEPKPDLLAGVDQSGPAVSATDPTYEADGAATPEGAGDSDPPADTERLVQDLQVLADGLGSIEVPAVAESGVSLLQYASSGTAVVLHVSWERELSYWHGSLGAHYADVAAAGERHLSLVLAGLECGIYENGGDVELSGIPETYKESLAVSDQGFAWVDFGTPVAGSAGSGWAPADVTRPREVTSALGRILFQDWSGQRLELTDSLRYRSRLSLSETHIAYVEYSDATADARGQVIVQRLDDGVAVAAAPSSVHQDRPSVDGEWVVWEEYPTTTDSVIRARNLATGDTRALSSAVGFRTNPDVREGLVVWEDQRTLDSDIFSFDLAGASSERLTVSGAGYSTGARLAAAGLVWIEVNGGNIGVLSARWRP